MSTMKVDHVTHSYPTSPRPVLRDVNLEIGTGEIIAIVGESGCGKTTLGRLVAGLHEPSPRGSVTFDGKDIWKLKGREHREWRRRVQMVHQDPYSSLNPGLTIGSSLAPGLLRHGLATKRDVDDKMIELLRQVGLDASGDFLNRYPHQLSGGQRQRASIARAISVEPELIVADEVTSMLDVSMRVAILDLLLSFRERMGIGFAFISHDFGVVRYFAQGGRIVVMFFGVIVEQGPTDELIQHPKHPYTHMLLESIPIPDPVLARERAHQQVKGQKLGADVSQRGCVFANRCPMVQEKCRSERPPLADVGAGHQSACWYPDETPALTHVERQKDVAPEGRQPFDGATGPGDAAARPGGATVHPKP